MYILYHGAAGKSSRKMGAKFVQVAQMTQNVAGCKKMRHAVSNRDRM